jgi:hypothetical protein
VPGVVLGSVHDVVVTSPTSALGSMVKPADEPR